MLQACRGQELVMELKAYAYTQKNTASKKIMLPLFMIPRF